jgi:hypothetical protein
MTRTRKTARQAAAVYSMEGTLHRRHAMSKQPTHRCATRGAGRTLAVGIAVATLVGILGAGQALAAHGRPGRARPGTPARC